MPSSECQWKPFWIPVGESFKKAFVEMWVFVSGDSSDRQNVVDFPVLHNTDHSDCIRETPRQWKEDAFEESCISSPCKRRPNMLITTDRSARRTRERIEKHMVQERNVSHGRNEEKRGNSVKRFSRRHRQ